MDQCHVDLQQQIFLTSELCEPSWENWTEVFLKLLVVTGTGGLKGAEGTLKLLTSPGKKEKRSPVKMKPIHRHILYQSLKHSVLGNNFNNEHYAETLAYSAESLGG